MAACASPLLQWVLGGERTFVEPRAPALWTRQELRCGKCAPCLLARTADERTRICHEFASWPSSGVLHLTYDDAHLPPWRSLRISDVSEFMNRLRERCRRAKDPERPLPRYDVRSEYSPLPLLRPHYHMALFNYKPHGRVRRVEDSGSGNALYEVEELSELWPFGRHRFEFASTGGAGYVAGHSAAKVLNRMRPAFLDVIGSDGSVIARREPEARRMSRRPGLGAFFAERYGQQLMELGFTVVDGDKQGVSRYYLRVAEDRNEGRRKGAPFATPEAVEALKLQRQAFAVAQGDELTSERREAIGEVKRLQLIESAQRRKGG